MPHCSFSSNGHFAFTLLLFLHLHLCLFVFCSSSMSTNYQLKSAQNCKRYTEFSDDSILRILPLYKVTRPDFDKYLPIIITKIRTNLKMVDPQAVASKKRTLTYMHANELTGRLTSKADFLKYLDNHCKYLQQFPLTSF